jgi:zinc protease
MRPRWEPTFASWNPVAPPDTRSPVTIPASDTTRIRLVNKPGLSQTSLMLGYPAPGELRPGRDERSLANHIFGGGNFSSRLMERIRSKLGKTYSIASHLSCDRSLGVFSIETATRTESLAEMLTLIMAAHDEFLDKGVTAEELDDARRFQLGNMAFQLEGLRNVVEKTLWLRLFGRDNGYIETCDDRLGSITREGVNAAIRDDFAGRRFTIVAVGAKADAAPVLERHGTTRIVDFRATP